MNIVMPPLNGGSPQGEVVHGMTALDYFDAHGLSHSGMKKLHPTPAHYLVRDEEDEVTPDMIMGTMVHGMVLDPQAELPKVAILPKDLSLTTKAGRQWRDDQQAAGFCVLKPDAIERVRAQALAFARDPGLNVLLRRGQSEVGYFRTVPTKYGNIRLKARVDFVPYGQPFLVDLKTCYAADPWTFQSVATKLRYYSQAFHYLDMHNALCEPGDERSDIYFYVVEKTPNHQVACYRFTTSFLEVGRRQVLKDIETYARCLSAGKFEGFPQEPIAIDPPMYLLNAALRDQREEGAE